MTLTFLQSLLIELVQGDDYLEADTRAVSVFGRGVCWPAAVPAVRLVVFEPTNDCGSQAVVTSQPAAVVDITGTFYVATSSLPAEARFDVPRVETLKLTPGVRRYMIEIRALMASGSVITLARGHLTVLSSQV